MIFAVVLAAALVRVADAPPNAANLSSPWCLDSAAASAEPAGTNGAPPARSDVIYARASRELCTGKYANAATDFASIATTANAGGPDEVRVFRLSYFAAELLSGHVAAARAVLDLIDGPSGAAWQPQAEDRSFWDGKYADAFAAYANDDKDQMRSPDDRAAWKPDPVLASALASEQSNQPAAALAALNGELKTGAPDDLRLLLVGNLYAQQSDWPNAFSNWLAAAQTPPNMPVLEFHTYDRWSATALEMIDRYRSHLPSP